MSLQSIPQSENQSQQTQCKQIGFMDRILWQPLAYKFCKLNHIPFEKPLKQFYLQKQPNSSNQILMQQIPDKSSIYPKVSFTYYVPTYIRLVIKNFTNIDHAKLQAEANVSIIITFVYGNKGQLKLPQEVAARLYNQVVLNFERDESLRLTPDNDNISVKEREENSEITFTVRRKVLMHIKPNIHYTPFETLQLFLLITIQQLTAKTMINPPGLKTHGVKDQKKYEATVKFNFMDRPKTKFITIDNKNENDFGNYSLIENSLNARYSNKTIKSPKESNTNQGLESTKKLLIKKQNENENEKKIKNFQYAQFQATIYKQPLASLFNIFLPLWGLAFINLVIYFQSTELADRIASIATLMVAFIALDDNIRIQIPPHPKVLFIQYLVYAEITASLICLWHSFALRNVPPEEKRESFQWTEKLTLGLSCIILLAEILLVIGRTVYHYKVEVPNFGLSYEDKKWKKFSKKSNFDHIFWTNSECDEDKNFKKLIKDNKVLCVSYKSEWTRKLQDLNDEIKRKAAQITFTYVKPSQSMMRQIEDTEIIINSHLLNRN